MVTIGVGTRGLGRTGLNVTVLGLGGAPLGDLFERIPQDRALGTISKAYEEGVRVFDTAPLYGHGLSEHRFGHVLRDKPRDDFVLSTKVGRMLVPAEPEHIDRGWFVGGLNFAAKYDYSYDGCMRSLDSSYHRLGMNRIDVALIHDVDIWTHGTASEYDKRFAETMQGAYRALADLRASGTIRAIGVGVNEVAPCVRFAREAEFDCFLLAGRYTLLEQNGLDDLLPLAETQGFSILLGGAFNSGILATGGRQGATYNYKPAPPQIVERVDRIEAICTQHGVSLAAAAIQFPLGHPNVASIVTGAVRPEEIEGNRQLMAQLIPAQLWTDLKSEKLLSAEAPVPTVACWPT